MFSSRKCSLNRFVIWIRSFTVLKLPPAFFVRAFISLLNLLMTTLYNLKNSLRHVLFGCARTIPSRRSGSLLRFREFQAVRGTDCLTKQGCLRGVVPPLGIDLFLLYSELTAAPKDMSGGERQICQSAGIMPPPHQLVSRPWRYVSRRTPSVHRQNTRQIRQQTAHCLYGL